jgi:hypothetical protein
VEKDLFATGSSDGVIKIWERCELDDTKGIVFIGFNINEKIFLIIIVFI